MRSPPAAKTVFVAWDHSVDEHQAELPTLIRGAGTYHTYTARCAGGEDPDGPISEDLCTDIRQKDCLLAFRAQDRSVASTPPRIGVSIIRFAGEVHQPIAARRRPSLAAFRFRSGRTPPNAHIPAR